MVGFEVCALVMKKKNWQSLRLQAVPGNGACLRHCPSEGQRLRAGALRRLSPKGARLFRMNVLRRVPLRRSSQPCTFAIESDHCCAIDELLLSLGAHRRCLQGGGCLVAVNTSLVTAHVSNKKQLLVRVIVWSSLLRCCPSCFCRPVQMFKVQSSIISFLRSSHSKFSSSLDFIGHHFILRSSCHEGEVMGFRLFRATGVKSSVRAKTIRNSNASVTA